MNSIQIDRIVVRKFVAADWEDLYEYLSLAETYIFEPGDPISIEEAKVLSLERSSSNSFHAVSLKGNGKLVGHLYLGQEDPKDFMTWELGYIFNPEYQNQGLCTEASRLILDYAFNVLKAHRVNAFCDPLNVASWRVLEKIGLNREGLFKKKAFFRRDKDGHPLWHDCLAYGIIDEDYGKSRTCGGADRPGIRS